MWSYAKAVGNIKRDKWDKWYYIACCEEKWKLLCELVLLFCALHSLKNALEMNFIEGYI